MTSASPLTGSSVSGATSARETPPKKSVMSTWSIGRPKRSLRTPGCELILAGS